LKLETDAPIDVKMLNVAISKSVTMMFNLQKEDMNTLFGDFSYIL
jgi:hypothetical protein